MVDLIVLPASELRSPSSSKAATSLSALNSSSKSLLYMLQKNSVFLFTRRSLDDFRATDKFGVRWIPSILSRLLPMSTKRQTKTGCWVAGQLLYHILQPNEQLEEALRKEKQRLNWPERCVALHVRHGWRARFNSHLKASDFMARVKRSPVGSYPSILNSLILSRSQTFSSPAVDLVSYGLTTIPFMDLPQVPYNC